MPFGTVHHSVKPWFFIRQATLASACVAKVWSWCCQWVDVELMSGVLQGCWADVELMYVLQRRWVDVCVAEVLSWCWVDVELMLSWCWVDVELMHVLQRCWVDVCRGRYLQRCCGGVELMSKLETFHLRAKIQQGWRKRVDSLDIQTCTYKYTHTCTYKYIQVRVYVYIHSLHMTFSLHTLCLTLRRESKTVLIHLQADLHKNGGLLYVYTRVYVCVVATIFALGILLLMHSW